jgi:hypothetical protein
MKRDISRALLAGLLVIASVMMFAAGCGVDDALVGGRCAAGYTQCGLSCVKGSVCDSLVDATGDGPTDVAAEAALADASAPDSTVDEDGSSNDDGAADGQRQDVVSDDASSNDALSSDAGAPGDVAAPGDGGPDGTDSSGDSIDAPGDSSADDSSDAATGDADAGDDSSTNDGSSLEAGNPCDMTLAYCSGQCIDVTADPLNCGACNVVCASQLCANSRCIGAASGGIVYIGHDFTTTLSGTAQARVLSNAVFIPQANPLHVMSYERYANPSAITRVNGILSGVAVQQGRTLSIRSTTNDLDVPNQLALPGYDVLLVHDQPGAPDGSLMALGASWGSTLTTFTLGGGVVVVLDGGKGIGQMPAFASGTGLLQVTADVPVVVGTPLLVSSRLDAVSNGVISPYGAGQNSVSLSTEPNAGNVVYVVEIDGDAGAGAPVVVHKAF